ncbi:carbohydrate-binding protein [Pelagicoccus enzymogenes]|uniref:LamG-like jellyroll fold domain-containing protein n=1 Tax=Pelagicoccus enzymogenes TaxID=2773457 RepID=UPI00280E4971|nr:LamG-like jellyroll fold domain-containing protein [Pelagicoccus enzymogenes]MDQ8197872.1 carbohydrate-binding protein [Pelagicoccus enzymogenes]
MNTRTRPLITLLFIATILTDAVSAQRNFVHPGISHKKSDLDRMKYMVEAKIDPWYSSYLEMVADSKSSYDYSVRGDKSFTELGRDNKVNYGAWNSDIRAAYYNAIRWYISGDTRHADKAVEIFNSWTGLTAVTSGGTDALSGGVGYIMIEAAEIIKSTYDGWAPEDIDAFKAMLVYPGYSNTEVPPTLSRTNGTFYWKSYQGDSGRHGNQGLSCWRTVMAMGIFLDNEIMYDRALRYIQGLPHRPDDFPYPPGPSESTELLSSDDYSETYRHSQGDSIEDYGYNEVMTHYIWENGQCQESSRDQQHVFFGIGLLCSMSEMAWNQGDDLYSHADDRLLLGLEYNTRYNVSYRKSYPDQETHWAPTVESGEFIQRLDRTGRWFSKAISPIGIGDFPNVRPIFEMPIAHYLGRGLKTEREVKWILRARDIAIDEAGYEAAGWTNDAIGWGGLSFRRPDGCYGDPIVGFANGLPQFNLHVLPLSIEAENYDHFAGDAEGRTYHDTSPSNTGGSYRSDEGVDIATCSEGGYALTDLQDGEWLTYTVAVPATTTYGISIRYAARASGGKIKFSFAGTDVTGEVPLPYGTTGSTGPNDWQDLSVATDIPLTEGVQNMRISISGASNAFELNRISFEKGPDPVEPQLPTRAHWSLDDRSGSTVLDSSGNQFHGSVTAPSWIDEPDRRALAMNGSSTSIDIPATVFESISDELSIAFWAKGSDSQPLADSIFYAVNASNQRILNIHLPFENATVYWDAGYNGTYDRINKIATDEEFKGAWVHWTFTKNASVGSMFIYRNGELWHSGTGKTKAMSGITAARIGSAIGERFYTGSIDDIRIYDIALSPSEIEDIYNINVSAFESPVRVGRVEITQGPQGQQYLLLSIPNSKPDFIYQVKTCEDLIDPSWTKLSVSQTGTGAPLQLTVPLPTDKDERFYQVAEKQL